MTDFWLRYAGALLREPLVTTSGSFWDLLVIVLYGTIDQLIWDCNLVEADVEKCPDFLMAYYAAEQTSDSYLNRLVL